MQEISWQAPEFIHYPKSFVWLTILIIVSLLLIGYFLLQKDFLAALTFILLFVVMLYFSKSKPKTINIQIDSRGVKLNDTGFPYQQIKSFWIVYEPPEVKTLNFETTAYLNQYLTLQLVDQDPLKIRKFLLKYLPEDLDRQEPLSDRLARKLKF